MNGSQYELWEREYEEGRIPSSWKESVSHSVEYLVDFLDSREVGLEGNLLDVGCGNGRNLVWFAEQGMNAYGIDIAENALEKARKRAEDQNVQERISLYRQSMTEPYPFEDNFFTIAICTTAIENLFTDKELETFKEHLERVLGTDGYLLLYYHPPQDGFYQQFVEEKEGKSILEMPEAGIKQRMYTQEEVKEVFGNEFDILDSREFEFEDKHSGELHERHLIANIWRKK